MASTVYTNFERSSPPTAGGKHLQLVHSWSLRRRALHLQCWWGAPSSLTPRLSNADRGAPALLPSAPAWTHSPDVFLFSWFPPDEMRSCSTQLEPAQPFAPTTARRTAPRNSVWTMRFDKLYQWPRFFTTTSPSGSSTESCAPVWCSWMAAPIPDFSGGKRGLHEEGYNGKALSTGAHTTPWRKNLRSIFTDNSSTVNFYYDHADGEGEGGRMRPCATTEKPHVQFRAKLPFSFRVASKKVQRPRCSNSLDSFFFPTFLPLAPRIRSTHPSYLTTPESHESVASATSTDLSRILEVRTILCTSAFLEAPCHLKSDTIRTPHAIGSHCTHGCEAQLFARHGLQAVRPSRGDEVVPLEVEHSSMLCNKVRNDKKDRKRAYPQRGFWKKQHFLQYKNENTRLAFAVQGIDLLKLKSLTWGEVRRRRRS